MRWHPRALFGFTLAAVTVWPVPLEAQPARECVGVVYRDAPVFQDPFVLFFELDSDQIRGGSLTVMNNMLEAIRRSGACGVRVSGHADRSGRDSYNLVLSRRRAESIRRFLRLGGFEGVVEVEAMGETMPMVATADGVAEPMNRYAAVLFFPIYRYVSRNESPE